MRRHTHRRFLRLLLLLWVGIVLCWPGRCLAQADSATVAVLADRLVRLDADLAGCGDRAAELARLLEFTEKFPHRYGPAEIKEFRKNLGEATACLKEAGQRVEEVGKTLPERPPPEATSPADETVKALHARLDALQGRMQDLATLKQQVEAQLDKLVQKLPAPDSTGYEGQAFAGDPDLTEKLFA